MGFLAPVWAYCSLARVSVTQYFSAVRIRAGGRHPVGRATRPAVFFLTWFELEAVTITPTYGAPSLL